MKSEVFPCLFQVMAEDIRAVKAAGAKGVVIGILTAEGDVDFAKVSAQSQQCCTHL